MTPELWLLLLRLLSAGLLLAFLGALGWLMVRDLRLTGQALAERERSHGLLRVIASADGAPDVGEVFPIRLLTSIGRAPGNNVVLPQSYTSTEHALITRRGQQWWLEDLGSRNGTLLNDVPLAEAAVVSAGDVITIGETQLKVELP